MAAGHETASSSGGKSSVRSPTSNDDDRNRHGGRDSLSQGLVSAPAIDDANAFGYLNVAEFAISQLFECHCNGDAEHAIRALFDSIQCLKQSAVAIRRRDAGVGASSSFQTRSVLTL